MLFDISGIHTLRVAFCLCDNAGVEPAPRRCQLLRACWFPATFTHPSTAFTFRLLDFFHKLQTQSKVNLHDFYTSLVFVNNSASQKPPVVSPLFIYLLYTHTAHTHRPRAVSLQRIVAGIVDLGSLVTASTCWWHPRHWWVLCSGTRVAVSRMSCLSPSRKEPCISAGRQVATIYPLCCIFRTHVFL